jgi:PHD/YefM family antitoxin component YafN of YafNO toxin-antitoxin module
LTTKSPTRLTYAGSLIASEARKNLYQLIDQIAITHEPTMIKGKRNKAVLISLEDWEDIRSLLKLDIREEFLGKIK